MVLGPENGEQEAEEKHHQAKANQANDWKETRSHRLFTQIKFLDSIAALKKKKKT